MLLPNGLHLKSPHESLQLSSKLSTGTEQRLAAMFAPGDRALVSELLIEDCGNNLPFMESKDSQELERVRFAVLKLSGGDLNELQRAIDLAKLDWRDVLVSAGFADNTKAHESWWPSVRHGHL